MKDNKYRRPTIEESGTRKFMWGIVCLIMAACTWLGVETWMQHREWGAVEGIKVDMLTYEPSRIEGTMAYADSVNWTPGGSEGYYLYTTNGWVFLGTEQDSIDAGLVDLVKAIPRDVPASSSIK